MSRKSFERGHERVYNEEKDKWEPEVPRDIPCKHCGKTPVKMTLEIAADLSHTGRAYTRVCNIDACIAPIVRALNKAGIQTRACCCGHGKFDGNIILKDGRKLIIKRKK